MCSIASSENIEIISAWELLQSIKLRQNESFYYPLKRICTSLGIKEEEFDYFMDYEIMTDYLMSNTYRHMNNIAIMRNPDSLEILGMAPIYDSGNSMFYNVPYEKDVLERHMRIPKLEELYERKRMQLKAFQEGRDIWKPAQYRV